MENIYVRKYNIAIYVITNEDEKNIFDVINMHTYEIVKM